MTTTSLQQQQEQEQKPAHVLAAEALEEADADFQGMLTYIESGAAIVDIVRTSRGDEERAKYEWVGVWTRLKEYRDVRNAKVREAKDSLRQYLSTLVQPNRGPHAEPIVYNVPGMESLKANTVTKRRFNGHVLYEMCRQSGLLDELLALQATDKKSGVVQSAIQYEINVDYQTILNWIETKKMGAEQEGNVVMAQTLETIFKASYVEENGTVAVTGAKEVAFVGEFKDSK